MILQTGLRCAVCHHVSDATYKVDWWDEDNKLRYSYIHAKCEKAFFSKWYRNRQPTTETR